MIFNIFANIENNYTFTTMKKIFTTLAIAALTCGVNAQSIAVDKAEEDGTRYIVTTENHIGGFGDLGLKSVTKGESTDFYINLSLTYNQVTEIAKGRKLLLKLKNGEIIMLWNTQEIGVAQNTALTGTVNSTFYYISPSYKVTEDELKKIMNGEVVKIRVDKNYGNYDVNISNNAFSSKIKSNYELIKEELKTKKTFTSDF